MKRLLILPSIFFLFVSLSAFAADMASARTALMQGRADDAIAQLQELLAANANDSAAHHLLCRVYYSEDRSDLAIHECESSASLAQMNGSFQYWLGLAYGQKADHAGPIAGFTLARKVVSAFERAVQLAPTDAEAISALGDFYANAPGIVGGGVDKARQLARRIEGSLPYKSHRILALAAEKDRNYDVAELEFKRQIEASHTPETMMDLAVFYQRRKRSSDAVNQAKQIIATDHTHGPSTADAASLLLDEHSELELAEKALRSYLASSAKTDQFPAFRAHVLLGKLLASKGDQAASRHEYDAALAIAKDYSPAKRATQER